MLKQMKTAERVKGRAFGNVWAFALLVWLAGGPAHGQDPRYAIRGSEVYDKKTDLT